MTYCSSSGRTDWQNAWATSPVLHIRFIWVAMATRRRSSRGDITGAKQSLVDQSVGSRFPRTTMRYFARSGFPFLSFLIFEMAIDGSALPMIGRSIWYCSSVIYSQVWVFSWRFLCRYLRYVCDCVVSVQLLIRDWQQKHDAHTQ